MDRPRHLVTLLAVALILALVSAGCGGTGGTGSNGGSGGTGKERTVVIGFTASKTGKLNVESIRQANGLELWAKQVNEAGGVTLKDGTKLKFKTKSYDDESNKDRVQELYTRLATQDKADFLISPYSSGLADAAAVIAEQNGKIMITTGAADDSTYTKGYTLVYQLYTPASRYLTGALDLLAKTDPQARKVAFVYENDKFSTSVVDAARAYAKEKGFQEVLFEGYQSGTTDFGPFIGKIQNAKPDAILGGGHFQDGSTLARQLKEKKVDAKYVALLVAPPEPAFAQLGDAALGVIGPSQWEPDAKYDEAAASKLGVEWVGPSIQQFVQTYKAAYNEEPSYHSAGGYASGLLLQRAIEKAGTTDTQQVKKELDAQNIMTFYGPIRFDTSAKSHGLQVGHEMVYVQWQKNGSGQLVKQIIWPEVTRTAQPVPRQAGVLDGLQGRAAWPASY